MAVHDVSNITYDKLFVTSVRDWPENSLTIKHDKEKTIQKNYRPDHVLSSQYLTGRHLSQTLFVTGNLAFKISRWNAHRFTVCLILMSTCTSCDNNTSRSLRRSRTCSDSSQDSSCNEIQHSQWFCQSTWAKLLHSGPVWEIPVWLSPLRGQLLG